MLPIPPSFFALNLEIRLLIVRRQKDRQTATSGKLYELYVTFLCDFFARKLSVTGTDWWTCNCKLNGSGYQIVGERPNAFPGVSLNAGKVLFLAFY